MSDHESQPDPPPLYDYSSTTTFALESDSDEDDLSNEAKRIMKKRKKEKEQLAKLGPLVPIDTEAIEVAESQSRAMALPLREKVSEMSVLTTVNSKASSAGSTSIKTSEASIKSNFPNPSDPRVSKSVAFGNVEQAEFESNRASSNADVIDHQPEEQAGSSQEQPQTQSSSQSCPVGSHFDLLQQYIDETKAELDAADDACE